MKKYSVKDLCPCQSKKKFQSCCEPFIKETDIPPTPEQLMRSRYTAYFLQNFVYIQKTMTGKALEHFHLKDTIAQSKNCKWLSLEVLNSKIEEENELGYVEFVATYSLYGKVFYLKENSEFRFFDGKWFYTDRV